MNYYERHLGDYARDTAHLTMIEHGAYGLLLDRCYATEQGIPDGQAHRLARARTPAERAAVDSVLAEFFTLTDGHWLNRRVTEEIDKAHRRIGAAKENGKRGGRPKKERSGSENKTQQKPSGLFVGSENETQQKAHQAPDTIHHIPNTSVSNDTHKSASPTIAGAVCLALKNAGLQTVNPSHPDLLGLLAEGATVDDFVNAARGMKQRETPPRNPFAYVLGVVKGQRDDAKDNANKTKPKGANHDRHDVEEPA
jgi:uncharacterized protein YdaU (DUF1376 family)